MTYYAFIQNNEINGCGECRQLTDDVLNVEIADTVYNNIEKYIWDGSDVVLNPNWEEEQANEREKDFKSKFFEIGGYGWYRKQPKGYTSAVESLNTVFNAVSIMQQLPARMLIFYQAPDFYNPNECTEEWLVTHQIYNEAMTAQEFGKFYVDFMTAWNNQEHVTEEAQSDI